MNIFIFACINKQWMHKQQLLKMVIWEEGSEEAGVAGIKMDTRLFQMYFV
jgi:hypothetical protein